MARLTESERFRLSVEEKDEISLASKKSNIPKSEIIRQASVKEAKRILKQIKKENVSNCCNAPIIEETDLCSDYKEHCEKK